MAESKPDLLEIRASADVVLVRQAVRARAIEAGFSLVDQTKIVTAASELARNTLDYGGGGLGMGLSGARRLSNEFAIESRVGEGTRVMIARWK